MLLRRYRVGQLGLAHEGEVLFYGEKELPPPHLIFHFMDDVSSSHVKWKLPTNYVIREKAHLRGWLKSFLAVEDDSLQERFNTQKKSFESWVWANRELGCVDIAVRLKTLGLSGYTEYRLSIVKLAEDEFLCVE